MSRSAWMLGGGLLACLVSCADFEREEQEFCERTPERCGQPLPGLDGGTKTDGGLPDAGAPDAGSALCGNSALDPGEVCDDGNRRSGDGCREDCLSKELCGNGYRDAAEGEQCDDGNTAEETSCLYGDPACTLCSSDCGRVLVLRGAYCSDGTLNGPEQCDDGNNTTETACPYDTPNCTYCNGDCSAMLTLAGPYCGDNTRNGPETCDDGNSATETECPYGTPTCVRCDAICSAPLNLTGPYCGDSRQNGPEACDDGNTTTEQVCPYGTPTCTACRNDCGSLLNLTGPYCGDGIINGSEVCDDGNADACGSCNAGCTQSQPMNAATGAFTVGSTNSLSGARLILDDGLHAPVTFQFTATGNTGSAIPIFFQPADGPAMAAFAAVDAINSMGAALVITAQDSSNTVRLMNDYRGAFGNKPLTTSSSVLTVNGMSGGSGMGCAAGTGCSQNLDCAPGLVCRADKRCGP